MLSLFLLVKFLLTKKIAYSSGEAVLRVSGGVDRGVAQTGNINNLRKIFKSIDTR